MLLAVRTYRSAGNTTSSHRVTASRKLATITVSATARLSAATTPLMAELALARTRRARSRASMGKTRWRASGLTALSSKPVSPGRAVMPPINNSAADR